MEIIISIGVLVVMAIGTLIAFKQFKSFVKTENKQSIHEAVNEAVKDEREKQDMLKRIAIIELRQDTADGDLKSELRRMNANIEKLFTKQDEHIEKFHSIKNNS